MGLFRFPGTAASWYSSRHTEGEICLHVGRLVDVLLPVMSSWKTHGLEDECYLSAAALHKWPPDGRLCCDSSMIHSLPRLTQVRNAGDLTPGYFHVRSYSPPPFSLGYLRQPRKEPRNAKTHRIINSSHTVIRMDASAFMYGDRVELWRSIQGFSSTSPVFKKVSNEYFISPPQCSGYIAEALHVKTTSHLGIYITKYL